MHSIIFNDYDLDILLVGRKNIQSDKKMLILYFLTLPNLNQLVDYIFLPESLFEDEPFIETILPFIQKIGISLRSKLVIGESDILDYNLNPLPVLKKYYEKFKFHAIHFRSNFGMRSISKSPKNDEYVLNSQYNWMNVAIVEQWSSKNDIKFVVEPYLYFLENSSEDFYIHMRQIFWEGIDIFRKMNLKFSSIQLLIGPFYPKLKGLRNMDILDSANVANTTLRCMTECLTKEKVEIMIKSHFEFSLVSYMKYVKHFRNYSKDLSVNWIISSECLKEYIKNWNFHERNLKVAQEELVNNLTTT